MEMRDKTYFASKLWEESKGSISSIRQMKSEVEKEKWMLKEWKEMSKDMKDSTILSKCKEKELKQNVFISSSLYS